jgi:hypothetical protein
LLLLEVMLTFMKKKFKIADKFKNKIIYLQQKKKSHRFLKKNNLGSGQLVRSELETRVLAKSLDVSSVYYIFVDQYITRPGLMERRFTGRFLRTWLLGTYPHNILFDDFNTDLLRGSQRLIDFISEQDGILLTMVSKEATYFQATVTSLIDLFITGEPGSVRTFLLLALPRMNTGHDLLYGYYHVGPTQNVRHYRNNKNVERLSRDFVELDWTSTFNLSDVNKQVCNFNDLVLYIFEWYVPWPPCLDRNVSNP